MAPVTNFAVQDSYPYLEGLGNYHQWVAVCAASCRLLSLLYS